MKSTSSAATLRYVVSRYDWSRLACCRVTTSDYCNAVLVVLPAETLSPFQRVLNAAARLALDLKPRDHLTLALRELHWLPKSKQVVSTRSQDIIWSRTMQITFSSSTCSHRSSSTCSHRSPAYHHAPRCAPPAAAATSFFHGRSGDSVTVRSLSLHLVRGIGYRQN